MNEIKTYIMKYLNSLAHLLYEKRNKKACIKRCKPFFRL